MRSTRRIRTGYRLFFLFPAILAPLPAAATVCAPLAQVRSEASTCEKNTMFAMAAQECVRQVQHDVALQQDVLSAAMALANAKSAKAQDAKVANQIGNLTSMRATLQSLLNEAESARSELEVYGRSFTWPGGYDSETVSSMGMSGFFSKYACYADSQVGITANGGILDRKIAELRNAAGAAGVQLTSNGTNLEHLGASAAGRSVGGAGTGAVPAGKSVAEESTVTGRIRGGTLEAKMGSIGVKPPEFSDPPPRAGIASAAGAASASSASSVTQAANGSARRAPASRTAPSPAVPSAGSALWGDANGTTERLELRIETRATEPSRDSAIAAGKTAEPVAAAVPEEASELLSSPLSATTSSAWTPVTLTTLDIVADARESAGTAVSATIFESVSRTYRRNELFRRPHPRAERGQP